MPSPTKITFTFTTAGMLKDALRLADEALSHTTKPLPNIQLGRETLECLKIKLDDMLQCEDWTKETPLDYNELHIMYGALQVYLIDLSRAGNKQLVPVCQQLCKQFSTLIACDSRHKLELRQVRYWWRS